MNCDRDLTEFLDQTFERAIKGTPAGEVPVNEESVFKVLVSRCSPTAQQISWLRHNIFQAAKRVNTRDGVTKTDIGKVMERLHSLIKILEQTLLQPQPKIRMAIFFPEDENAFAKFYRVLSSAKSSLDVCVFTITDIRIAELLISAHRSGKRVRVITDDDKSLDDGSDIQKLKDAGIDARVDHSPAHMHHKFCIVDNSILVNGSFNWTKSASVQNNENVTIIEDSVLVNLYGEEFEKLWKKFGPLPEEMTVREAVVRIQSAYRGYLTRKDSQEFKKIVRNKKGGDGNNNNQPLGGNGGKHYPRSPSMPPLPHSPNSNPPMTRAHTSPYPPMPRSPNSLAPNHYHDRQLHHNHGDHRPRSPNSLIPPSNHDDHRPRSPSNYHHVESRRSVSPNPSYGDHHHHDEHHH